MTKHYKYQLKKLSELKEYDANSRTHSPEQIEQLQRSIKEFGFTSPVLFDENNILVAGHARCIAAANLGMNEVPAIFVDGLTAEQRSALVITDNKLALSAGWNFDALRSELNFLEDAGFDVSLTGFDIEDFNMDDDLFDEGDYDEVTGEPKKTDEGYSEFAIVMPYDEKVSLVSKLNKIKTEKGLETNYEAMAILVQSYD
jgi:hypothetical protein|tara:strand:+ start:1008 stop:1607 length:600 start_codon:yes stop_codon:yes gene_type:complete